MDRTWRGCGFFLPVLLGVLLALPGLFAQETTAGLQGVVKDPSGGTVANATVEITGTALLGSRKAQTDVSGAYRITALPSGEYSMTVTASGFRTYKQSGIELSVGRLPSIDVVLQVGSVTEILEISGAAPLVDVTQSKVAVEVPKEVINDLPKGRSFQSLITLAPGARMEPLQGGRNNRSDSFQVDGASDAENVYL